MKYIIADKKNTIYWGPRDWSVPSIQYCIKNDFTKNFFISSTPPEKTLKLDDNIFIYPVQDETPVYNEKLEVLVGPYFSFKEDYAIMTNSISPKKIEQLKYELKQQISHNRYIKEISGINLIIQDKEVNISTRREDRDIYSQMLASDLDNFSWKFNLETWINLSRIELSVIVNSINIKIQESFKWEFDKSVAIDNCNTLEELDLIELRD